uniref:Ovule protein n=1 Tax=Heterorhabditis bacteriophora TaxID=37862 RepID=A0A1I7XHD7_HETBA
MKKKGHLFVIVNYSLLVSMRAHSFFHRMILAGTAVSTHLIFITYLHFGFHVILEEIDFIMDGVDSNTDAINDSITLSS